MIASALESIAFLGKGKNCFVRTKIYPSLKTEPLAGFFNDKREF